MSYQRIRQELTDLTVYFLMPIPALILPWRIAYRWYRYIAGKPWLFEKRVKTACHNARQLVAVQDVESWRQQHRLTLIIDHTDFWISWLQPRRARRLLHQCGTWPDSGPFIVIGTHYGCGFMLMRALQRAGVDPYFIFRKTPAEQFRGQRIRQFYVYLRLRHQKSLFPDKCYHPGSYPRRLLRGLDQGCNILVLVDVPAERNRPSQSFQLFGRAGRVDRGMFDILIKRQLRYVTYQTHIDFTSGQRSLEIASARHVDTETEFWADMQRYVNDTLATSNSQWHLWQVASLYFLPLTQNVVRVKNSIRSSLRPNTAKKDHGRHPDFLIIGAQKSGTSWLHHNLRRHVSLYLPDDKDADIYLNSAADRNQLLRRMAKARKDQICGDSNAAFLWTPSASQGAPLFNPDIAAATRHYFGKQLKLIVLLRDPVMRTVSAYLHHIGMGALNPNTRLFAAPAKLGLLAHSQYGSNLQHWRSFYPDSHILVLPTPDKHNPKQVYSRCLEFLQVDMSDISDAIKLPVFKGLSRIFDDEGVWVNLTHPIFKHIKLNSEIKISEYGQQQHALLITRSELDRLTEILTADTRLIKDQLPATWMHKEFLQWSTWRL